MLRHISRAVAVHTRLTDYPGSVSLCRGIPIHIRFHYCRQPIRNISALTLCFIIIATICAVIHLLFTCFCLEVFQAHRTALAEFKSHCLLNNTLPSTLGLSGNWALCYDISLSTKWLEREPDRLGGVIPKAGKAVKHANADTFDATRLFPSGTPSLRDATVVC